MNKIFLTSDTHFFHKNIILPTYCNRPFSSEEEMRESIIENWNSVVSEKDDVYHLGDFAFLRGKRTREILKNLISKLTGKIYFIPADHDSKDLLRNKDLFYWCGHKDSRKRIKYKGIKIIIRKVQENP